MTYDDERLRDRLKKYRYEKAKELNYKPYFIFMDRTLNELIIKKPVNYNELRKVEKFADKKIKQYGIDILMIIQEE